MNKTDTWQVCQIKGVPKYCVWCAFSKNKLIVISRRWSQSQYSREFEQKKTFKIVSPMKCFYKKNRMLGINCRIFELLQICIVNRFLNFKTGHLYYPQQFCTCCIYTTRRVSQTLFFFRIAFYVLTFSF